MVSSSTRTNGTCRSCSLKHTNSDEHTSRKPSENNRTSVTSPSFATCLGQEIHHTFLSLQKITQEHVSVII